jgi:hypothetical protein
VRRLLTAAALLDVAAPCRACEHHKLKRGTARLGARMTSGRGTTSLRSFAACANTP